MTAALLGDACLLKCSLSLDGLGVTLEKVGHHRLSDGPRPDPAAIDRALGVTRWAAALGPPRPGWFSCSRAEQFLRSPVSREVSSKSRRRIGGDRCL